jgi:hypothetical protein
MAAKKSPSPAKTPKVRKRRWYRQLWDVYQMTRRHDPAVTWWMLLAFVGVVAVAAVLGAVFGALWYGLVLGVPTALLVALTIMGRRAEKAAYGQIEGQPGAAVAALGTLRRGWTVEKEPVAVDPRTQDLVFRAVGRPGIVLISEGPASRVGRLLENERKRIARLLPNVPVHLIQLGNEEGQTPLMKLTRTVQRQKGKLTAAESAEVAKRLKALGAARPPIPKGIDPTRVRPDRKGMRGR